MTVLYWPRDEYDCTAASRRIEHPDTIHVHCKTDAEVIAAIADPTEAAVHWAAGRRYRCLRGPGGLVRAVVL